MAEENEVYESCDGKTVSNEILKGQIRKAKSGRTSQKTKRDGEHYQRKWKKLPSDVDPTPQGSMWKDNR